jgi:predicted nuclease with TOPRIM domain
MSEEIAIEVVLSKRDAEKAKLTIVNAELSNYESDKKALDEELRVLSRKVSDLDKSIQSKKDGLIRDGLVQKLAALQLERDEVDLADLYLVCIRHDC